jgi:D-arabinose 1-dehydrogenase-like Zn-dependent alcohol dehydrogenase
MRVVELPAVGAPLRLAERAIPEPGPGEVRVRIEACGVCGSDVFLQKGGFGDAVRTPVIPGHEAAGVVDAVGEGVDASAAAPGDQVALYYITTPPGDRWAARSTAPSPSTSSDPSRPWSARGPTCRRRSSPS